jgi:hypothetical protein
MALSKEAKAERRAKAAGPHPRPRGRTPRDADGRPKEWDRQSGGWKAATMSTTKSAVTTTADATSPTHHASAATIGVAAVSVTVSAAAAAVTWEAPRFWDHDCKESSCTADPLLPGKLQEHVEVTPGGSRKHCFKHISPGGTRRVEHYKSPADRSMAIEERCAWRLRIAGARKVARKRRLGMDVEFYVTECAHCHRMQHIMPNGCMFPHSMRETLSAAQRAQYRSEHDGIENMWRCPGSSVYYGPQSE